MNEGGQSSTGQVSSTLRTALFMYAYSILKLIDFILTTHPAYPKLEELAKEKQKNIHEGEYHHLDYP